MKDVQELSAEELRSKVLLQAVELRKLNKVVEKRGRQVRRLREERNSLRGALATAMEVMEHPPSIRALIPQRVQGPVRLTDADRQGLREVAALAAQGAV